MDLVPAISGGVALFFHAQHPYGALLLVDFLLSPEGQKMLIETFKHDCRHSDRAAGGQDMLEIDAFFVEVALALGNPDGREVEARGGSCESYLNRRFCLCPKRRRCAQEDQQK